MPSFQGASSPLLLAMPVFIAAALLGYQVGRMALRAKQELEEAEEKRKEYEKSRAAGMQHHLALRQLIYNTTGRGFGVVKRVYAVPGGGPGSEEDAGYPPWTEQRVAAALQRYDSKYQETTAFLALGAGSMNVASPRRDDNHVIFESTRISEALVRGGVPPGSVIADFFSWDTVGNAWFARLAVEALLDMAFRQGETPDELHAVRPKPARGVAPRSDGSDVPGHAVDEGQRPAPVAVAETKMATMLSADPAAALAMALPPTPPPGASSSLSAESSTPRARKLDVDDDDPDNNDDAPVAGDFDDSAKKGEEKKTSKFLCGTGGWRRARASKGESAAPASDEEKVTKPLLGDLPAARAGEAYEGGEIRQWMFQYKAKRAKARRGPMNVTVFVSDFHAERMDAVFQWVFGLEPSLLRGQTTVTTVSLDTPVEIWACGPAERQARLAHERKATEQARLRAREIRTVEEFRAFMTLGGHAGYFNRTHGRYTVTPGAGWGGTS